MIRLLDWDTEFFGYKVGTCMLNSGLSLSAALRIADLEDYRLIYIYSSDELIRLVDETFSVLDVGGQVIFCKRPVSPLGNLVADHNILFYNKLPLSKSIHNILLLSGRLSRFRIDPLISDSQFSELYSTWLRNTLLRHPFGIVFTYQLDGEIVGLLSAEWNRKVCTVGLLAVLESAQGRGIATKLVQHIEYFCLQNQIASLQVKTQLSNLAARGLYLKCGFSEQSRAHLYHAHHAPNGT